MRLKKELRAIKLFLKKLEIKKTINKIKVNPPKSVLAKDPKIPHKIKIIVLLRVRLLLENII